MVARSGLHLGQWPRGCLWVLARVPFLFQPLAFASLAPGVALLRSRLGRCAAKALARAAWSPFGLGVLMVILSGFLTGWRGLPWAP